MLTSVSLCVSLKIMLIKQSPDIEIEKDYRILNLKLSWHDRNSVSLVFVLYVFSTYFIQYIINYICCLSAIAHSP